MNEHQRRWLLRFLLLGILLAVTFIVPVPTRSDSLQQTASFLQAPYYGSTSVSSIFDHDANWDRILAFTGAAAEANNCPCPDAPPGGCVDPAFTRGYYSCDTHSYLYYDNHRGIDYLLRYDYVRAAASGDVVYAGWDEPTIHSGPDAGLGLYVHVRHSNDYDTLYGHMSVLRVETNDNILDTDEFQRILGISGNTGNSSGPHLHFEVRNANGTPVDPYGPDRNPDHELWIERPSIDPHVIYTSGNHPLTAPLIVENESGYITVDDGSADFVEDPAGCWTVDTSAGWAGDHRYRDVPDGDCTATWNFPPSQPAGRYHVFVHVPNLNATTDAAQYTLRHTVSPSQPGSKQTHRSVVNQLVYPNTHHPSSWVYVGTYYFNNQYGTDYVRLEAQPLDLVDPASIAADAVRFAPVVYRTYLPLVMKRWPPIPDTPVLNPIYNPYNDGDYAASWNPAYLADTYTLQEATNANFIGAVTRYSGTSTSWSATDKAVGTYYYRVRATNSWGNSGWSNIEQTTVLPPAGWQTIASQNFEGAFPGSWIVWDDNGTSDGEYHWGKRTCRPYAGSYSGWGVGGGSDGVALACGSYYPHDADGWMYYGPFNLEDAITGELGFKLWLYTELYDDYVFYGASIDGIHFEGYRVSGNTQGWDDVVLDLADVPTLGNLLGQSQVWVALVFSSNSSVNYAEGGYVDDVVLRECLREPCPGGSNVSLAPGGEQVREIPATMIRNR